MPKAPKASPKAAATEPQPLKAKRTVTVIYRPLSYPNGQTDPAVIVWNKITFHANVPVELDPNNKAHGYEVPLPKQIAGQNGEMLTKHVETWMSMIDLAKNNPSFEVDGKRARARKNTRIVPPPGAEWTDAHEGQISESDTIDESVAA